MNLDRYTYDRKRTYKEYSFFSTGPKGRILKIVRFDLVYAYPVSYYNLILGDWDNENKRIDDEVITNNGDAEKVLATVANIVLDFTDIFRKARIFAKGNIPVRTRLYQMYINKFLTEIETLFKVSGYLNKQIQDFEKNVNYEGFMIVRKEYAILEEQTETYMTSSSKKIKEKKRIYNDRTIDGPELVDIENDPVVLKKREDARRMLDECVNLEEYFKGSDLP